MKLLLLLAHPKPTGAAALLAEEFSRALPVGAEVETVNLCAAELPSFSKAFAGHRWEERGRETPPPEILKIVKSWREADAIAFFLPNWWGVGPAELMNAICWLSDEIALFDGGRPKPKMRGKKVFWVVTGAAPLLIRKLIGKTNPAKLGKEIFQLSGAKLFRKFFNGAKPDAGEIPESWKRKIRALARK